MSAIGKIRYYDAILEKVVEFNNSASWCDYYEKKNIKETKPVCNVVTFPLVLPKENKK